METLAITAAWLLLPFAIAALFAVLVAQLLQGRR